MSSKANPTVSDKQQAGVPAITARIAHVMGKLGIAGLPRNYELLFEALNGNAGVAREVAALRNPPEQTALDAIALRHSLPSHNVLAAGQAAGEAVRLLTEIAETAEGHRRQRAAAVQELEEIASRMREDPVLGISDFSSDAVRLLSVVNEIVSADRSSAARMEDLQTHLAGLRSGLSVSREALTHDPVTGLGNQAALLGRLKEFFEREADGSTGALLMFRVEQLQGFAETHPAGAAEKTLKQLAAIFRRSVKKADYVARTAPDVFCLLLCDVSREIAVTIARRVAAQVAEKPFPFMDRELAAGFLTLSAGISISDSATTPAMLYEQADQARAHAEQAGTALRVYSAEVAARGAQTYRAGRAA
jgi:diguanylate cyclase